MEEIQTHRFQSALVELSRHESVDLTGQLARLCSVAATTLDVGRVSVWLFNEKHTELECVHLFDRGRDVHECGAVLAVERYPRYFESLEESRTIAASDAASDP